jgi:hypothetical protein
MKKQALIVFVFFLAFIFNTIAYAVSSLEETESAAIHGNQKAQCELGCALWTGTFGNVPDGNYRTVSRNANKAYGWLVLGTDFTAHGKPTESTYSFIVDALNSLGSYYEVEVGDTTKAKENYKKSADLFVEFGGKFEETIAGRNYNRLETEE